MKREVWNDCMGLLLCVLGLWGVHHDWQYAGWLIFFGLLFFCATGSDDKDKQ